MSNVREFAAASIAAGIRKSLTSRRASQAIGSFVLVVWSLAGGLQAATDSQEELLFDGSNYKELDNVSMTGSRSIEFWFGSARPNHAAERWEYFDWTSKNTTVRCYHGANREICFVWLSALGWRGATGKYDFAADEWVHVVCVFDKSTNETNLYLNGEPMFAAASAPIDAPPAKLRIGAKLEGSNYFKGKIKGFTIHERALTDGEIARRAQPEAVIRSPLKIAPPKMVSEGHLRELKPIMIEGEAFASESEGGLRTSPGFSGGKAQSFGPAPFKAPARLRKEFNIPGGRYWVFLKGYCSEASRKYRVEIDGVFVERWALTDTQESRGANEHKYHLLYIGAIEVEKSPPMTILRSMKIGGGVDCIYLLPITQETVARMKEMPETVEESMSLKTAIWKVDSSPDYKGLDQDKLSDLMRMQTPDISNLLSYSTIASYARKETEFAQPLIPEVFAFRMIEGKPFRFSFLIHPVRLVDTKTGSDVFPWDFGYTWGALNPEFLRRADKLGYPFTHSEDDRCGFVGVRRRKFSLDPILDDEMEAVRNLKHFLGFNLREDVGCIYNLIDGVPGDGPFGRGHDRKVRWDSEGYWNHERYRETFPKTKEAAYAYQEKSLKWLIGTLGRRVTSMSEGALPHYVCLADRQAVSLLTTELGSPAVFYQFLTSATRGAARQFGLPWGHYIAQYGGNSYVDGKWVGSFGMGKREEWNPFGGLCPSLLRRAFYFSYMSGANVAIPEMEHQSLLVGDYDKDGIHQLSPRGKVFKEWRDFTLRHPDRGVPFTPCAIVLDPVEGYFSPSHHRRWNYSWRFLFPYEKEDYMADKFFGVIWPGTWGSLQRFLPPKEKEEEYYKNQDNNLWYRGPFLLMRQQSHLVNTPYGDVFDILASKELSEKALNSYSVVFLLGRIRVDEALRSKLMTYVREGGRLVMTTYHTKCFDSQLLPAIDEKGRNIFEKAFGKGKVVVMGSEFLMDEHGNVAPFLSEILHSIIDPLLPFKVVKIRGGELDPEYSRRIPGIENAPVQFLINKKSRGWVITLLNNNGVHESDKRISPVMVYPKGEVEIELLYKGRAKKVIDWLKDDDLSVTGTGEWTRLHLTIPPGHIRVFEFVGKEVE